MDLKIKTFYDLSVTELYNILKLRNEVFIEEQQCAYNDIDGKDISSIHLFLCDNDQISGYLRILPKGLSFSEVSIGRVIVRKDYRFHGYARFMMNEAINYILDNLNEKNIIIEAQVYVKEFYKSLGFKEISKPFLDDGIPHVEMLYRK